MSVVFFLLDTLFFFLLAACLLRAWMNQQRVQMTVQPGRLVLALTDWLVRPLRRTLPGRLLQNRIDWGSLLAAVLLALVYAGCVLLLAGWLVPVDPAPAASLLAVVALALQMLARTVLQGLMVLLLVYAVLSWVQPQAPVLALLERLCGPLLRPVRRIVPPIGGVDLSVLLLIILLQVGLMLLG